MLAIMIFTCTQYKRNRLVGMLFVMDAEGNFLQVDCSSQIFVRQLVPPTVNCRQCTRQEFIFSDSVLCMGKHVNEHVRRKLQRHVELVPRAVQGIRKKN